MRERPILFSGPMVRALLKGKTQTRRIAKLTAGGSTSPYGGPGGKLWVREAVGLSARLPVSAWQTICADHFAPEGWLAYRADDPPGRWCWRPSIHMPRWASRITLTVTEVRIERLQDISEADAEAEGVDRIDDPRGTAWKSYEVIHEGRHRGKPHPHSFVPNRSPVTSYRELWDSINGAGAWEANPWVWVVSFGRAE